MAVDGDRRVQHLQRVADIGRAGATDILGAVAVARDRQALALGRWNMAAGVADALARVERRHRMLRLRMAIGIGLACRSGLGSGCLLCRRRYAERGGAAQRGEGDTEDLLVHFQDSMMDPVSIVHPAPAVWRAAGRTRRIRSYSDRWIAAKFPACA